jgi:hypothetical protein
MDNNKIPSTKFQIPNKSQYTMTKTCKNAMPDIFALRILAFVWNLGFVIWCLFVFWCLGFGIYSFAGRSGCFLGGDLVNS